MLTLNYPISIPWIAFAAYYCHCCTPLTRTHAKEYHSFLHTTTKNYPSQDRFFVTLSSQTFARKFPYPYGTRKHTSTSQLVVSPTSPQTLAALPATNHHEWYEKSIKINFAPNGHKTQQRAHRHPDAQSPRAGTPVWRWRPGPGDTARTCLAGIHFVFKQYIYATVVGWHGVPYQFLRPSPYDLGVEADVS